jgi:hypothetical protein
MMRGTVAEAAMRSLLVRKMRSEHAFPVENRVRRGTPDVSYIDGWAELKWLRGWPAKGGPVALPHFTAQQRVFLSKHWKLGGRAFLVLQVRSEWMLWAGCDVWPIGALNREELGSIALSRWNGIDWDEFRWMANRPMIELEKLRKTKGICDSPYLKCSSSDAAGGAKTSHKLPNGCDSVSMNMRRTSRAL